MTDDSHMTHEEQIKWMADRIAHLETQYESAMEMVATLMGKLNTAPPQREWQGLTNEEVENFVQAVWPREATPTDYIRAIEAALKAKNA